MSSEIKEEKKKLLTDRLDSHLGRKEAAVDFYHEFFFAEQSLCINVSIKSLSFNIYIFVKKKKRISFNIDVLLMFFF